MVIRNPNAFSIAYAFLFNENDDSAKIIPDLRREKSSTEVNSNGLLWRCRDCLLSHSKYISVHMHSQDFTSFSCMKSVKREKEGHVTRKT